MCKYTFFLYKNQIVKYKNYLADHFFFTFERENLVLCESIVIRLVNETLVQYAV